MLATICLVWAARKRSVKMSGRVNACPAAAAAVAAHVRLMSVLTTVGKSCFYVLRAQIYDAATHLHNKIQTLNAIIACNQKYQQRRGCTLESIKF